MNAPTHAVHAPPLAPQARVIDTLHGLPDIFEPQINLLRWRRPIDLAIRERIAALTRPNRLASGWRRTLRAGTRLPSDWLADAAEHDPWREDIQFLTELFADLTDCVSVGIRLEVVTTAMCPRFHVDRTGLRLLCTYQGPATEWLDEEDGDRSRLGPHADTLLRNPGGVQRADRFDVLLLKGELWPGNAGRGIMHRSPEVEPDTAPRVLLALDALW